jgi:hypothetical protein
MKEKNFASFLLNLRLSGRRLKCIEEKALTKKEDLL